MEQFQGMKSEMRARKMVLKYFQKKKQLKF